MASTLRRNAPLSLDVGQLHKIIDQYDDYDIKIHQAAKWYAANKIMIVPFMHYGYPKGLSQRHATYSPEKIEEWFHPTEGKFPGASIAMAHGGQSGFCAIDLDQKPAKGDKPAVDGMGNLADLQMAYGSYDDGEGEALQTLMASTPSGGRHLVFRYHPEIINNAEEAYPGIDTRGGLKKNPVENGGITFVEPSRSLKKGITASYRWDETVTEISEMPPWLVDVLNGRKPQKKGGMQLQEAYIESAAGDHGDGRDRNIYIDLMRFVGIGYDEEQLWDLMPDILDRMDPPDEDMVRRKIESAINSDAFTKAKVEQKTKKQVASVDLIRDGKERIIKCVENLEIILSSPIFEHEYGVIEFDEFTKKFIIDSKPLASMVDWSIGIQSWIAKKFKVDFPKTDVRDRVEYMAYTKPHANIAREYMLSCIETPDSGQQESGFWGSKRLGPGPAFYRLCYEVLDLKNKALHPNYTDETREAYEGFLWFWLQGVAARACVPGCKMEIVLNIFGGQGIGKSLFFRALCPNPKWFTDSIQDSIVSGGHNNRDELMKLHGKIIVEMPELSPIKSGGKSADDKLKQFISTQEDNMRLPYGHDSIDCPRTCALAGTSNNRDVYRDSTGARRFVSIDHGNMSIKLGDQANGVLAGIRKELWGEVARAFQPGELESYGSEVSGFGGELLVAIPPQLRDMQAKINDSHRFEEIGVQDVMEWISDKTRVTWAEIVVFAKTVPGLRDAKESMIMAMTRKLLSNDPTFEFKKRITRHDEDGKKQKTNCWVNLNLQVEKDHTAGIPAPDHWSKAENEKKEAPEY